MVLRFLRLCLVHPPERRLDLVGELVRRSSEGNDVLRAGHGVQAFDDRIERAGDDRIDLPREASALGPKRLAIGACFL